jgi:hypothetical protein
MQYPKDKKQTTNIAAENQISKTLPYISGAETGYPSGIP